MCKGPDEPGGPYRCSGDMKSNLEAATTQLTKRADDDGAAAMRVADSKARVDIQLDEEIRLRKSGQPLSTAFTERSAELDKMHADAKHAKLRTERARDAAIDSMKAAAADFDATPRGLGELARAKDEADAELQRDEYSWGHEVAHLDARITRATNRMNLEARERREKNPTMREKPFEYIPVSQRSAGNAGSVVTRLAHQDKIAGMAKDFGEADGAHRYQVTLTRRAAGEDKIREITAPVSVPSGNGPLTSTAVLTDLAVAAADHARADGTFEGWRSVTGRTARKGTDEYRESRSQWDHGKLAETRLRTLVGDRYDEYVAAAGSPAATRTGVAS